MLTVDRIKEVVALVGKRYGIKNAYLFGSYAKGKATEDSDVDLIIDEGAINGYFELGGFYNALVDELGTDVDILVDDSVEPRFFDQIKKDRILLYER